MRTPRLPRASASRASDGAVWLAVRRPGLALALGALLALAAAAIAAGTAATPATSLLTRDGAAVSRATAAQERAFGGEPIVIAVEGDLAQQLQPETLTALFDVEVQARNLRGVHSVVGPGSLVVQAVAQINRVIRDEFGPAAERAQRAAAAAEARARRRGESPARIRARAMRARLDALGDIRGEFAGLLARYGSVGLPSITNRAFIAAMVLGTGSDPKARLRWMFPDRRHSVVIVRPRAGLSDAAIRRLGRELRAIVRSSEIDGVTMRVAGAPLVAAAVAEDVAPELARLALPAGLALALALLLTLGRSPRRLLLLVPAVFAVALTAALSGLLGLGLTPATVAALPVVLGLAVDFAVQLQVRFWAVRRSGDASASAAAVRDVAPVLAVATAAMTAGFLAMTLSPVPLISRLGVTLALGTLASLAGVLLLGGPLLRLASGRRDAAPRLAVPARLARLALGRVSLVVVGALTAAGLLLSHGTPVQSDPRALSRPDLPELRAVEAVQRQLGSAGELRVAVTGENVTSSQALTWLAAIRGRVVKLDERLRPGPNLGEQLTGREGAPDADTVERLLRLIPPSLLGSALSEDRTRVELAFGVPLLPADEQAALIARIERILDSAPPGITAQPAGLLVQASTAVDGLRDGRPALLILAFVMVFLVLLLVRREVRRAAIPLVPAVVAAGVCALGVRALGITLTPLSAALEPLVLAVGVEFGLLLEARYHEGLRRTGHPGRAAQDATRLVGAAVLTSALAVAVAFASLTTSRLPLLREFGALAAIELLVAAAAAVLLVPGIAAATDRRRARRRMPVERPAGTDRVRHEHAAPC